MKKNMTISIDFIGAYTEHKPYFDAMAKAMQLAGHRVGIITGEREIDPMTSKDKKQQILSELGFKPDFIHLWGAVETIANGDLWKCQKMDQEDVYIHFDDDATSMKKYTQRWIVKTLNSSQLAKF